MKNFYQNIRRNASKIAATIKLFLSVIIFYSPRLANYLKLNLEFNNYAASKQFYTKLATSARKYNAKPTWQTLGKNKFT